MYELVLRNGTIISGAGLYDADIAIQAGRIAKVSKRISEPARSEIDARGLHVMPGVIDPHVHFGVPVAGVWSADDHRTGSLAAICGGVTTVGDFTVQEPQESLVASVKRRRELAGRTWCDWFLHANLTSVTPQVIQEIPKVVEEGIRSFKVFLAYPGMLIGKDLLEVVLQKVYAAGALTMVHCEDQKTIEASTEALALRGHLSARYFFKSRPAEAEAKAIELLGELCIAKNATAYVVHLSSAAGLEAARNARKRGARLFLETCPQYLFLSPKPAPPLRFEHLVCAPPLRSRRDRARLTHALASGEIDCLATDHCPFTSAQKIARASDFRRIPSGLPGVETLLPLAYDMALRGVLPLERLAQVLAEVPATLFGLSYKKGFIREGFDADLVLLSPQGKTEVSAKKLHSATDYNPYEGLTLRGHIEAVLLRGHFVAKRTSAGTIEPVASRPIGVFVHAKH